MKPRTPTSLPNLTHVQSFYAVAKHGSLAAAARAEGGSLPTLSRHIVALEQDYNVTLFDRRGDGLALTQTGVRLFEYAEEVRAAGARFAGAAEGRAEDIAGTVRLSASHNFANFVLPEILAQLGQAQPEIDFELIVTDSASNLLMREADIAIRMFRPQQSTLIAKKIGEVALGAYATPAYIARKGAPQRFEDLKDHDIVGDDSSDQLNADLRAMGVPFGPEFFRFRCDDPIVAWNMVLAGCGIGLGHIRYAETDPRVQRILQHAPALRIPVWLTSHPELKTSARVRIMFDFLAKNLARKLRHKPAS